MQLTAEKRRDPTRIVRPAVVGLPARRKHTAQCAVAWSIAALAGFLLAAAVFETHPEWRRHDPPDWRPLFARAQAAVSKDRYEARYLYVSAARAASWAEDWRGLVAAACGLKKLDGARPNDAVHGLLLRAMIAAETGRSRAGLAAVAQAFAAAGETAAAAMVLARAGADWPKEPPVAQEAENAFIANCGTA
jgi:hypothetical protein